MSENEKAVPTNGDGAPPQGPTGTCQACKHRVMLEDTVMREGRREHLVPIHRAKPGRGVRPCGPVLQAWIYWVTYVVRLPGLAERTEAGPVAFDAQISHPAQLQNAQEQLAAAEAAKVKAVDRETGSPLVGGPAPEIRIMAFVLLQAV